MVALGRAGTILTMRRRMTVGIRGGDCLEESCEEIADSVAEVLRPELKHFKSSVSLPSKMSLGT